ncbi:kinase-like domain-containing protein [Cyathus striatus]|nr:kinase-like domain-containing protein [Cyathus striatus]
MPNSANLTTEEGVRLFLVDTPFACTEVRTVSGGNANFVYRLHLIVPYRGNTTLICKHAEPYVRTMLDVRLSVDRQLYEVEALRSVKSWLPSDSVVTVPEVHHHDKEHSCVIMEDLGYDAVTLKAFMQEHNPSTELASRIGNFIGEFLGQLHVWGQNNAERCNFFEGNMEAKRISAWVYYGRLVSTLTGENCPSKLTDPPLEINAEDIAVMEEVVEDTTKSMIAVRDSVVMGDFWPGNLIVSLDKSGNLNRIFVVDWEMSRLGVHGIEVGQFSAEVHMLYRFNAPCKESAPALLEHFLKGYRKIANPDDELCRTATIHTGVHMVTLAPRISWGEKDLTRDVVLEGVSLVVNGRKGDLEWVKQSLVGGLIS